MRAVALGYIMALVLLALFGNILLIGKPRTPLTPGNACFNITVNGLAAWAALYLWASA